MCLSNTDLIIFKRANVNNYLHNVESLNIEVC
jgi:hypothetical protein